MESDSVVSLGRVCKCLPIREVSPCLTNSSACCKDFCLPSSVPLKLPTGTMCESSRVSQRFPRWCSRSRGHITLKSNTVLSASDAITSHLFCIVQLSCANCACACSLLVPTRAVYSMSYMGPLALKSQTPAVRGALKVSCHARPRFAAVSRLGNQRLWVQCLVELAHLWEGPPDLPLPVAALYRLPRGAPPAAAPGAPLPPGPPCARPRPLSGARPCAGSGCAARAAAGTGMAFCLMRLGRSAQPGANLSLSPNPDNVCFKKHACQSVEVPAC